MRFLHSMLRVSDPDATIRFFKLLGLEERRRMDNGVTINRPPRDGRMAFIRTPDSISIELLQKGPALAPAEPWASMPNSGEW